MQNIRNNKIANIVAGVIIACLVIGGVYWLFFWRGDTSEMRAVADKLAVGKDWTLVSEEIRPAQNLCVDGRCPELNRKWTAPSEKPITKQLLQDLITESSLSLKVEGDCTPGSNGTLLCRAIGSEGKWRVEIYPTSEKEILFSISNKS